MMEDKCQRIMGSIRGDFARLTHDSALGPFDLSGPRCIFPFRLSVFHEPSYVSASALLRVFECLSLRLDLKHSSLGVTAFAVDPHLAHFLNQGLRRKQAIYICRLREPGLAIGEASFRLFTAWSRRNERAKHERSKCNTGVTPVSWGRTTSHCAVVR
jgi:hypothetical protein